jgi:hypothetical protein
MTNAKARPALQVYFQSRIACFDGCKHKSDLPGMNATVLLARRRKKHGEIR